MIIKEMRGPDRIYHYSDQYLKIRQIESGIIYDDAEDSYPCKWTYEETDIPIEDNFEEISENQKLEKFL